MSSDIAGVIVEPIAANMGVIPPAPGFLEGIRDLTSKNGSVFICDEVITGFRVSPGGAAELMGIKPDLVCLGKILGGGLPCGAVGGKKDLIDLLAPIGKVYQAGTLSGNPLSMSAGIANLKMLFNHKIYNDLKNYTDTLVTEILNVADKSSVKIKINKVHSLFTVFFASTEINDFESAGRCDMGLYAKFFHYLLENGIFIPPSGYEAWFISTEHKEEELRSTIKAIRSFLEEHDTGK
jgi:glutamate-1-semialdehyde 2,1-aminomutase